MNRLRIRKILWDCGPSGHSQAPYALTVCDDTHPGSSTPDWILLTDATGNGIWDNIGGVYDDCYTTGNCACPSDRFATAKTVAYHSVE